MKEVVVKVLKKALKEKKVDLTTEQIERLVEIPPSAEMGDYSFPCFFLSEKLKDNPSQIALEIREKIGNLSETDFEDIQTKGPYINFFVNRKSFARQVVWDVITRKKDFGKTETGKGKRIIVEFSSPNIAKPFGIGHLRSTIIGNSLANIFEFQGFKVTRLNYLGDWGTQFGRLLFAYEKYGSEKKLDKDPIEHLYNVYVKANKKSDEKNFRELFKKLEDGDRKSLLLWKLFRGFSLEEYKKIYTTLGIKFDVFEAESEYNKKAKVVQQDLQKTGLLKKSEGALVIDLEKYNLGTSLIEKTDGTTLYSTRDLAAATERYKKYKFDKMIYETGQEQNLHFNQFFKILELMGNKWAKNCIHVDHGLYLDKKGKKFSTRKGKTVFLKDVFDETTELAKKEIVKRAGKISKDELEKRALKVAIAAIFYGDLKSNRTNNIVFDIKKFISFDGDTGPYILYSYARAGSILKKAAEDKKFEVHELEEKEVELVKKISQFSEVVNNAQRNLNPSLIANYSYQLAQTFNEFYHACKVIGSEQESFRLALVQAFRLTLKNSLKLLGIETVEEM
ncbi:MAG: arginine--tRNA ligase [Nanoarchaeota archaeon]